MTKLAESRIALLDRPSARRAARIALALPLAAAMALLGSVSLSGAQQAQQVQMVNAQTCKVAQQCHGFLPQLCRICDNGRSACAHFACVKGQCEIETCPPK